MENELYHHGILGMKWGIRRFQNYDGSLTKAGKAHVSDGDSPKKSDRAKAKEKARAIKAKTKAQVKTLKEKQRNQAIIDKAKAESEAKIAKFKGSNKESENSEKKSWKNMTDEELRAAISRKQLENQYKQLNPQEVSAGQKFAKSLLNDVVVPAAKNAGKQWLEKTLKESLGLNDKQISKADKEFADLQKEVKKLTLEEQKTKIMETRDARDKAESDAKASAKAEKKEAKAEKQAEKAEAKAEAKAHDDATSRMADEARAEAKAKEPLSGDVFGNGTSHDTYTQNHSGKYDTSDATDAVFSSSSPASEASSTSYYENGISYANQLLLEYKPKK